jgi:hypothetical protein
MVQSGALRLRHIARKREEPRKTECFSGFFLWLRY